MRVYSLLAVMVVSSMAAVGGAAQQKLSLGKAKVGELPPAWKCGVTGKAAPNSEWKIVEDKTAPGGTLVLAQTSNNPGSIFNLCIAEDGKYKDVDISISFKAVAGQQDQGGGIIWRVQDNNNYYIVRFNPLEDNFRLYKVVAGSRKELFSVEDIKAEAGKWHTMRVVHKGDKIQCYLNGKMLIEQTDDTFKDAGKFGLWTKADAQTYFADVQITAKKE